MAVAKVKACSSLARRYPGMTLVVKRTLQLLARTLVGVARDEDVPGKLCICYRVH